MASVFNFKTLYVFVFDTLMLLATYRFILCYISSARVRLLSN